ncbi:hypothetical protein GE061_001279 [Apolygus lucorum]|uniref:Uncharacterized protein n=1 Tax=Apolygus lucorum TaxID=248454 RepID=A0A6A4IPG1_APOLU|nr:hypothetical protein GE061_001279 [Apolygus lucorum]
MASGGYRLKDGFDSDSDVEIDIISAEEMTSICDVGNEQTWLFCPRNADPNSYVDLSEFLQVQSSIDDKEQLYRAVVESEASKSGGIDTRTFTRPKKMSLYHPLPKMSEQGRNTYFQPSGGVNTRISRLSNSPIRKDVSSLKDVTNSTFDSTMKKPYSILHRILSVEDFNFTDQTMIADMSTPSFVSISDSDDGISENIPNVSMNSKYNESRMRRGRSVETKSVPQSQPQFQPPYVSTPSVRSRYNYGGSALDISDPLSSSGDVMNRTINLDRDEWPEKPKTSTPRSPAKTSTTKMVSGGVTDSFTAFDRVEKLISPKSSPKLSGLRRLSYNNTFRLSKSEDPKIFKSVESGLDSTFELPNQSPGRHRDLNQPFDATYSSTGNIPRSLGDVHLAAQQQEYQLRDDSVGMPNVAVPTLKSPMKKVLSENCIFTSNDDGKLRVASSHHGSVSNLTSNNNKDNNNQPTEFPSKISSAGSKKNLSSGLPIRYLQGYPLECPDQVLLKEFPTGQKVATELQFAEALWFPCCY